MKPLLPPDLAEATQLTRQGRLGAATRLIQRLLGRGEPVAALKPKRAALANATSTTEVLAATKASPAVPTQGQVIAKRYTNAAGTRAYKLYIPSSYRTKPLPLIVMLHGCTQSADDFAVGTGMNAIAEELGFLVAYPEQSAGANPSRCWNWFQPADQRRDSGEPSLIAGITAEIAHDYTVDPRRIYVAGLSAGGALAAIMGAAYPDVVAAVGVHSGLPVGAARDLPSALGVMRNGKSTAPAPSGRAVPTIVFHGDQDMTVHPRNGSRVFDASAVGQPAGQAHSAPRSGGHAYSRTTQRDGVRELWIIHGAGHAWSGGNKAGSFTDPRGPCASREMVRFFMAHKRA